MNRKQLVILLGVLIVLGGAGLLLMQREEATWIADNDTKIGRSLLTNFNVNDVAHIRIKDSAGRIELGAQRQRLARQGARRLPLTLAKSVICCLSCKISKSVQSESVAADQRSRLNLPNLEKATLRALCSTSRTKTANF